MKPKWLKIEKQTKQAIKKSNWPAKIAPKVLKMMREAGVLVAILLLFGAARADLVNLDIIAKIESSNNPLAISYRGAKYGRGLYQISEIALLDYNRENNAKIAPTSLFEPKIGEMVAQWLFEARLPQILQNKGIPVTLANLLIAYNFGPGNLGKYLRGKAELPEETKNYLKRYFKLARLK
jgi:hypothetical protein